MRRAARPLVGLIACVALATTTAVPGRADAAPRFRLATVAEGLDGALYVTAAPGDPERLFVVQQGGLVRVVAGGRVAPWPFLDVSDRISTGREQGLLGLAFHPGYADNGRLFVNYTDRAGDTRVVEYRVSADPDAVSPESARTVLVFAQPYSNHNGGHLAFGPDGMLYVGSGDGGGGGDPEGNGQRLDTLLGKILRIDVDRAEDGRPYGIPPGNPFAARDGARPEIWAYGLRNPWRFSFDRDRGDLWIGDVGQNAREEIDFRAAGAGAGANFGWSAFEGTLRYPGGSALQGSAVPPVAEYGRDVGCSVTGGYVYRGAAVSSLRGRYVYGDYCTGALFTMLAGPRPGAPEPVTGLNASLAQLTSFGEGLGGELHATAGGTVYRLAPAAGAAPGGVTLSAAQLRINQRVSQAAIRRLAAIEAAIEGLRPRRGASGEGRVELSARQLRINQRIAQAAVRRANALAARLDGRPPPARRAGGGSAPALSARQLLVNQRIAQAAVRRANALAERVPDLPVPRPAPAAAPDRVVGTALTPRRLRVAQVLRGSGREGEVVALVAPRSIAPRPAAGDRVEAEGLLADGVLYPYRLAVAAPPEPGA